MFSVGPRPMYVKTDSAAKLVRCGSVDFEKRASNFKCSQSIEFLLQIYLERTWTKLSSVCWTVPMLDAFVASFGNAAVPRGSAFWTAAWALWTAKAFAGKSHPFLRSKSQSLELPVLAKVVSPVFIILFIILMPRSMLNIFVSFGYDNIFTFLKKIF